MEDENLRQQIEQYNRRLREYEDRQRQYREEQERQAEMEAEVVETLLTFSENNGRKWAKPAWMLGYARLAIQSFSVVECVHLQSAAICVYIIPYSLDVQTTTLLPLTVSPHNYLRRI